MNIIGRAREINELRRVSDQPKAAFIALYGRRRVGKTFLAREFYSQRTALQVCVTGQKKAPLPVQLANFQTALEQGLYQGSRIAGFKNWRAAFEQLVAAIRLKLSVGAHQEILVFLDELPWLATPRSDLLSALDYSWNTELSRIPQMRLVVAGSAASWIIKNIVRDTGGLHNRLTTQIRMLPFTFPEMQEYCMAKGATFSMPELLELYYCFGGVPYYLDQLSAPESAAQNIDRLLFRESPLTHEYPALLEALFRTPKKHIKVIAALGRRPQGISRAELAQATRIAAGGALSETLEELQAAGFIQALSPFGFKERNSIYRLQDEFLTFYMHWLQRHAKSALELPSWLNLRETPAFYSWAGYAFESLLLKHHAEIKRQLGFEDVLCEVAPWRVVSNKQLAGCQIDLIFDRHDGIVTLCEMKYTKQPIKITAELVKELEGKSTLFSQHTKSKKRIQWVVINNHYPQVPKTGNIRVLCVDQLFEHKRPPMDKSISLLSS